MAKRAERLRVGKWRMKVCGTSSGREERRNKKPSEEEWRSFSRKRERKIREGSLESAIVNS